MFQAFVVAEDLAQSRAASGHCLHCTLTSAVLWSAGGRERCSETLDFVGWRTWELGVLGKYELDRETLPAASPTCHTILQEVRPLVDFQG